MTYVLLDIDGVLVTGRDMNRRWREAGRTRPVGRAFDPQATRNLRRVLERWPDARVVLNSTWRWHPHLKAELAAALPWLADRMIGDTPHDAVRPEDAVRAWRERHPDAAFVCVDDSAAGLIAAHGETHVVLTSHATCFSRRCARQLSRKLGDLSCKLVSAHTCPSGLP